MRKLLVFQHVPYEMLGTFHPLMKEGFRIRYVNYGRPPYPEVDMYKYDGLSRVVWDNDREDEWLCFLDADGSVDGPTFINLLKEARELGPRHAIPGRSTPCPARATSVEGRLSFWPVDGKSLRRDRNRRRL